MADVVFLAIFCHFKTFKFRHNLNNYKQLNQFYQLRDFTYTTTTSFFYFNITDKMRLARPSTNPHGKDPFFYGFRSYIKFQLNLMAIILP